MHRVKQAVSEPLGKVIRFLCSSAKMSRPSRLPIRDAAASRPKTPSHHVCPANILPTFKQALLPIGLWHACRWWCQTLLMVAGEVPYAVTLLVTVGMVVPTTPYSTMSTTSGV